MAYPACCKKGCHIYTSGPQKSIEDWNVVSGSWVFLNEDNFISVDEPFVDFSSFGPGWFTTNFEDPHSGIPSGGNALLSYHRLKSTGSGIIFNKSPSRSVYSSLSCRIDLGDMPSSSAFMKDSSGHFIKTRSGNFIKTAKNEAVNTLKVFFNAVDKDNGYFLKLEVMKPTFDGVVHSRPRLVVSLYDVQSGNESLIEKLQVPSDDGRKTLNEINHFLPFVPSEPIVTRTVEFFNTLTINICTFKPDWVNDYDEDDPDLMIYAYINYESAHSSSLTSAFADKKLEFLHKRNYNGGTKFGFESIILTGAISIEDINYVQHKEPSGSYPDEEFCKECVNCLSCTKWFNFLDSSWEDRIHTGDCSWIVHEGSSSVDGTSLVLTAGNKVYLEGVPFWNFLTIKFRLIALTGRLRVYANYVASVDSFWQHNSHVGDGEFIELDWVNDRVRAGFTIRSVDIFFDEMTPEEIHVYTGEYSVMNPNDGRFVYPAADYTFAANDIVTIEFHHITNEITNIYCRIENSFGDKVLYSGYVQNLMSFPVREEAKQILLSMVSGAAALDRFSMALPSTPIYDNENEDISCENVDCILGMGNDFALSGDITSNNVEIYNTPEGIFHKDLVIEISESTNSIYLDDINDSSIFGDWDGEPFALDATFTYFGEPENTKLTSKIIIYDNGTNRLYITNYYNGYEPSDNNRRICFKLEDDAGNVYGQYDSIYYSHEVPSPTRWHIRKAFNVRLTVFPSENAFTVSTQLVHTREDLELAKGHAAPVFAGLSRVSLALPRKLPKFIPPWELSGNFKVGLETNNLNSGTKLGLFGVIVYRHYPDSISMTPFCSEGNPEFPDCTSDTIAEAELVITDIDSNPDVEEFLFLDGTHRLAYELNSGYKVSNLTGWDNVHTLIDPFDLEVDESTGWIVYFISARLGIDPLFKIWKTRGIPGDPTGRVYGPRRDSFPEYVHPTPPIDCTAINRLFETDPTVPPGLGQLIYHPVQNDFAIPTPTWYIDGERIDTARVKGREFV